MYALAFDLDTTVLAAQYHNASWTNAYKQIRATLEARSFVWIQQSLYHVNTDDMGVLFLAIQDLRAIPWFPASVKDIRAYRVDLWSDFTPIVRAGLPAAAVAAPVAAGSGAGSGSGAGRP
jgi:virulence-associated protein VapD